MGARAAGDPQVGDLVAGDMGLEVQVMGLVAAVQEEAALVGVAQVDAAVGDNVIKGATTRNSN